MAEPKPESIKPVLIRSAYVACVVGPILTLINQYDAVMGPANLNLMAFALTMSVPFLVSTFSGLLSRRQYIENLNALRTANAEALKQVKRQAEAEKAELLKAKGDPQTANFKPDQHPS